MSAAPFGPHSAGQPPDDQQDAELPADHRPTGQDEESELARLRREIPAFGFFFDGRHWWGIYGSLVIVGASDLDLLRERFPEAVRTAHEDAARNHRNDHR
ncbi:hypothetical protein [Actinoallomurus sp. NPDC052274]|uniref:hypothetical protein n=1 Tax=Actinoallomurus sp. NPDC052274 TaxID=3155420 RepID=UPI00342D9D77